MTSRDYTELLETLEEISGSVNQLTPELIDKKVISDIMLAMEKILPESHNIFAPKLARLVEALALLYEKFLMEMVPDGSHGLAATREGISLIQGVVAQETAAAMADARSDELALMIEERYGITLPPADPSPDAEEEAPVPGEAVVDEPTESGAILDWPEDDVVDPAPTVDETIADALPQDDADDDFFGDAVPPEQRIFNDDNGDAPPVESPEAQRISSLASDVTLLNADFSDKKGVSDLMLAFETLAADYKESGQGEAATRLALAMAAVFETSIMGDLPDGEEALKLVSEGVKALGALFSGYQEKSEAESVAVEVTDQIVEKVGVTLPEEASTEGAAPAADTDGWGEALAEEKSAPTPEPTPSAATHGGRPREELIAVDPVEITVASEDDLIIYSEFVSETSDTVTTIEEGLLQLEENPNDMELINTIFRSFHSLKGAAGFLGLTTVNILCHESETLLDKLRKKAFGLTQSMIDVFLQSVDVVKSLNEKLGDAARGAKDKLPDAPLSLPRANIEALVVKLELLASGEDSQDEIEDTDRIGDILVKTHVISEEQLGEALSKQKPVGQVLVDMKRVDEGAVEKALRDQEEKRKKAPTATSLKVDTEKLDSLLELVGELVISQSIVIQDQALLQETNRGLHKNLSNLGKITKNIQDHVMSLRMVPLRQTFQKMSRLVRDLSRKMGKPVHFNMIGEDTEIDKTLIEELNDPLVHLMRNALDHGIEPLEERSAAGKASEGLVTLSAYHKGGNVYIELIDDGKGIDRDKIFAKGVERGMVQPGQEMTDAEVFGLIFEAGFSTAAKVTDVSGRGVGMDVVRSNIDRLGGRVEIASELGKGSTFTVKLPLTMAIVDGMIVRIGGERFIIPTIAIRESIRPGKEEISTVRRDGEMINIRGRLLPLIRLHQILQVTDAQYTNPWEGLVIIVESDDKEYGLMVDDLLGQQQVVIKSLGPRFRGLSGISGGTILGDGRVGLILDVSGVVGMN